jgi:hypothetical protein
MTLAHGTYHCQWCHAVKARTDIIFVDDKPVCRHGDGPNSCKEQYYASTRPRPVPRSYARYEHG